MKELNDWCKEIHEYAIQKGWWEYKDRNTLEMFMLMVSEIAEATEEYRNDARPFYMKDGKPEGEAIELIDCIIRIMDYFGHKKWDMDKLMEIKMEYNKTRPYRHGGKKA